MADAKMVKRKIAGGAQQAVGKYISSTTGDPLDITSAGGVEGSTEGLTIFFDVALDLLCLANTDGYFLKLNPAWETTLGYTMDELTAVQFLDFVHPDDVAGTMEAISELASQQKVIDFVNRYRSKDGTYRWLQWRSAPSGDLIIAAARDITEQKRFEEEQAQSFGHLEELVRERTKELERINEELTESIRERVKSEARAESFLNLSLDMFSMPGFDGYFKYVNPAWERTLGYTREEILSTSLTELIHPDDRDSTVEEIREIGAGKETMNFRNRYRCKDGSYRWLSWSAVNVPEEQVMFAVAQDITDMKSAELDVAESKDELEAIYNGLGDGLMVVDVEAGTVVRSNHVLDSMLGYSQEELTGMPITRVHPPEELQQKGWEVEKGGKGMKHVQDLICLRKDGSTFPVDMTGTSINYKGRPSVVAIMKDATERKKAGEALKASEQTLQTIFDSMPGLLSFKNRDNVIVRANKMFADSLGMQVEEIEGRPLSEIFPDQGEEYWKDDLEVIESGKPKLGIEEPLDTPEGTTWLRTDMVPYRDTDGEIIGVVGFSVDITERKRAEEELRLKESAISTSINGIAIADMERRLTYVNGAFLELHGYESPDEVLGREILEFVKDERELAPVMNELLETGSWVGELKSKRKDGLLFDGQFTTSVILDERGNPVAMLATMLDITERKRAEELIKKNSEELKNLIEIAAHELRHPATVFRGYAQILISNWEDMDRETIQDALSRIDEATTRLIRLVDSLLETSRIERGKIDLSLSEVDPAAPVRLAIEEFRSRESDRELRLNCAALDKEIMDAEKVKQVLVILIDNAVKYSDEECPIDIECVKVEGEIVYRVADLGPGIPDKDRGCIFERFYQVADVLHHSLPGIGLGLYIAKTIVEVHGGWISEEPRDGGGSVFSFGIPAVRESDHAQIVSYLRVAG